MKVLKKVFILNKGQVGHAVAPLVESSRLQAGRSRVRISNDPRVVSASNINEYLGHLSCGKGGGCFGLTTLLISCADYLEILGASGS